MLTVLSLVSVLGAAQTPEPREQPTFEQLPDWSGMWEMTSRTVFDLGSVMPADGDANTPGVREYPPYNDEWESKYRANLKLVKEDRFPDPIGRCVPPGYPRLLNLPGAYEFVVRPEQVWILSEDGPNVMRIYTDGRDHPPPEDSWPTWAGESVGRWEDEMLIFETKSLKGAGDTIIDRTGLILSEQAHIVTQMRQIEEDLIEVEFHIEDPEALTEPWEVTKHYRRLPEDFRMIDFACGENQRNPVDATGRTLTLDADGDVIDDLSIEPE